MSDLEQTVVTKSVSSLRVTLAYGVHSGDLGVDIEHKVIQICFEALNKESIMLPEEVTKKFTNNEIQGSGKHVTSKCVCCGSRTDEVVRGFRIGLTTIPSHKSCMNELETEVVNFCMENPEIIANEI